MTLNSIVRYLIPHFYFSKIERTNDSNYERTYFYSVLKRLFRNFGECLFGERNQLLGEEGLKYTVFFMKNVP